MDVSNVWLNVFCECWKSFRSKRAIQMSIAKVLALQRKMKSRTRECFLSLDPMHVRSDEADPRVLEGSLLSNQEQVLSEI